VKTYCRLTGVTGPLCDDDLAQIDRSRVEVCGQYALAHTDAKSFLYNRDIWCLENLPSLSEDNRSSLISSVSTMFVQAVRDIAEIVFERDLNHGASGELLPVLPMQLASVDMRQFDVIIINDQKPRLLNRLSTTEINHDEKDFFSRSQSLRGRGPFQKSPWGVQRQQNRLHERDRFSAIRAFCRDLATSFPNTASVESDFSILGWGKDAFRKSLTDFSLEGILHCKQFDQLMALCMCGNQRGTSGWCAILGPDSLINSEQV
jgi:hypothetical protein